MVRRRRTDRRAAAPSAAQQPRPPRISPARRGAAPLTVQQPRPPRNRAASRRPSLLSCSRSPGAGAQTDDRPRQNLPPGPDGAGVAAAPGSIPPQVRPAAASPPPPPPCGKPRPRSPRRSPVRRAAAPLTVQQPRSPRRSPDRPAAAPSAPNYLEPLRKLLRVT